MTCFGTSCKQFKKYATYDYYLKLVTDYISAHALCAKESVIDR